MVNTANNVIPSHIVATTIVGGGGGAVVLDRLPVDI